MATAAPTVMTSSQVTLTPRKVKPLKPKNWGTARAAGGQM